MKLKYNFFAQGIIGYLLNKGINKSTIYSVINIKANTKEPMEHELSIDHMH